MKIFEKEGFTFIVYEVEKYTSFDLLEFIRTKLKEAVERRTKNEERKTYTHGQAH